MQHVGQGGPDVFLAREGRADGQGLLEETCDSSSSSSAVTGSVESESGMVKWPRHAARQGWSRDSLGQVRRSRWAGPLGGTLQQQQYNVKKVSQTVNLGQVCAHVAKISGVCTCVGQSKQGGHGHLAKPAVAAAAEGVTRGGETWSVNENRATVCCRGVTAAQLTAPDSNKTQCDYHPLTTPRPPRSTKQLPKPMCRTTR
jgi:hypothetical protein